MKKLILASMLTAFALPAAGEDFYPVEFGVPTVLSSSTSDDPDLGDLWPVSNLLQGPGVGFDVDEPHTGIPNGENAAWVTNANAGFPADYIEQVSIPAGELPRIVFDFGADAPLDEISVWAYSPSNSNGVSEFVLEFASEADGPDGFGQGDFPQFEFRPQNAFQCGDDPTWLPAPGDDRIPEDGVCGPARQSFEFGEVLNARYVALTVTDNYYYGDGRGGSGFIDDGTVFYEGYRDLPGGDRAGLGEVAFRIPVPPTLDCDFDGNEVCDIVDLDELLYTGIPSGDAKYDLDESGTVDLGDRDAFLAGLGTVPGDFDLDQKVVAADLNILGGNWTMEVSSYGDGDANGDRQVNAADLNAVGSNWQFGNPPAAAVPEPNGCILVLGAMLALFSLRRNK